MANHTQLLGTGLYTVQQAARLVGTKPRSVKRWLQGYERSYKGERVQSQPLWHTQLENEALPGEVIGFRDLLELRLVAAFVRHGVNLRVIRATIEMAAETFGDSYPLTNKKFRTDGKRIFLEAIETATDETRIVDVLQKQFVFSDIIRPALYEGIEYGPEGPDRWFPSDWRKAIVLDPAVQFGNPALTEVGIPTDTIYAAFLAEGKDRFTVARVFNIPQRMVRAAVEYEEKLAA